MNQGTRERGAAAVEFAILLPVLILIVVGIFEFGRAWFVQGTLSGAAREGAREMAIHQTPATARQVAADASVGLAVAGDVVVTIRNADGSAFTPTTDPCPPGKDAVVTVNHNYQFITGLFGSTIALTGEGAMRCGG